MSPLNSDKVQSQTNPGGDFQKKVLAKRVQHKVNRAEAGRASPCHGAPHICSTLGFFQPALHLLRCGSGGGAF